MTAAVTMLSTDSLSAIRATTTRTKNTAQAA